MPAHFRVDHLGRAPARFDETQLAHWQKEALARASTEEVMRWLQPILPANVNTGRLREFVDLVRHNVVLPQDAQPWVKVVFADLPPPAEEDRRVLVEAGREFFREAVTAVERHGTDLPALSAALQASTGKKGAALYKPLRLALTGRVHGPELAPLMKLLPVDTVRRRLEQWSRN
jgi:glutamyl-tRNA synthetase